MLSPNELKKIELEETPIVTVDEVVEEKIPQTFIHPDIDTNYVKGKIAEILGEDPKDVEKYDIELSKILEYTKNKKAESLEDILWEVRYVANMLGTPGYGESRLKFLYEYIYLLGENQQITNKLKTMESFNA
jgi:NTP pyrophosphatase (non-canonical NTP hydrolase)